MAKIEIDKLFLEVDDVTKASNRIRSELGLDSTPAIKQALGGATNRLIPVGTAGIVLAPRQSTQASPPPAALVVTRAGWVVRVHDIGPHAERLGLKVRQGRNPVSYLWAGVEQMIKDPWLPIWIQLKDPLEQLSVEHSVNVSGVEWFELNGDESVIRSWVGNEVPVRCLGANSSIPAIETIAIGTSEGQIIIKNGDF